MNTQLLSWQHCFRTGIVPHLSRAGLLALKAGLEANDQRIMQGATTTPPPLASFQDEEPERTCPVAFAFWQGEGLATVGEVEEAFAQLCYNSDCSLGEPAGTRRFLNWWDDTPREEVVPKLLAEVNLALEDKS